ncbi:hypothetical protein Msub_12615 [Marinobacter subterrani]|uniref:Uncharacterized protein n=1 Tax=Marinobacter subterrani TaxID=1658765 RepID=A0A0J7JE37_9GAMM|nr:hypothetical protein Msub_12615 [Marinobacter subterrani]
MDKDIDPVGNEAKSLAPFGPNEPEGNRLLAKKPTIMLCHSELTNQSEDRDLATGSCPPAVYRTIYSAKCARLGRKANVQANRFWNMRSRRVGTLRMIVITGKDVIARCQAESWHLAIGVTH